jgi:hypothetical protein
MSRLIGSKNLRPRPRFCQPWPSRRIFDLPEVGTPVVPCGGSPTQRVEEGRAENHPDEIRLLTMLVVRRSSESAHAVGLPRLGFALSTTPFTPANRSPAAPRRQERERLVKQDLDKVRDLSLCFFALSVETSHRPESDVGFRALWEAQSQQ